MKKVIQLVILFALFFSLPIQSFASVSSAVTSNLGKSNAAVTIRDIDSGKIVYSQNGDKLMRPASNMKLISGGAALSILGEDYRFTTDLFIDGKVVNNTLNGNVYIKGSGDPTLNKESFQEFAKILKRNGIRTINGHVIGDDTAFSGSTLPPGVDKTDETYYFGARTSAITMSQNADFDASTIIITAKPGKVGAKPSYSVEPNLSGMVISNQARTVKKGNKNTLTIKRSYNTNRIIISGNIPQGSSKKEWVTLQDPSKNTMQAIKLTWQSAGIKFSKDSKVQLGKVPQKAKLLYTNESRTLASIFPAFMKLSNNSIADILVKAMGKEQLGEGSTKKGVTLLKSYAESLDIPVDNWRIVDGSGLSNSNLVTTNSLSQLLFKVQKEPYFNTFYRSLPIAGNDERFVGGTLRKRLTSANLQNRIYAKTGYIPNVYTLSGYIKGQSGKEYIFSILLHNTANGNAYIDRTMTALVKNL
ncbi:MULTISPECIES: D-alanyl-D-alanine carboxypeptidase/D-alanyl-D-alanine endopeptidase [Solibacillus]|uniref:D-alanyl-D-alanine carboxypeptidase/D-alanyl-D-alanine-endopeptidase n=1 Tax=Solibacillus faecavium TaxID=2762221 RepID=A0ABR8XTM1_9BACL|nr:D-alanyl-D-alanine carboxypeptidase/D-alanyl-D-alanine-endopeptidase [Solibacillus faecavium]MBD8035284.1 D-alanyl-D-alanine carboxypeptidase/D-alanyl-D-alanine-endopeptidase [Solibacillus faecavium]